MSSPPFAAYWRHELWMDDPGNHAQEQLFVRKLQGDPIMAKRLLDIFIASAGLIVSSPLVVLGILGIKLSSRGSAFYRARRIGRGGHEFSMFKLRTMHVSQGAGPVITGPGDSRVFGWGNFLRKTKIDEIPQLWNVVLGDMSLVGPRPEDPEIVARYYTDWMLETLSVRPGLTSPGALMAHTHGSELIDDHDPEGSYVNQLLAPKLALDRAYVDRAGLWRDLQIIGKTIMTIALLLSGCRTFSLPPEASAAQKWAIIPGAATKQ